MVINANESIDITRDRLIIVEGPDDHAFFTALLAHLGYGDRVQLISAGGKDSIRERILAVSVTAGFDSVVALGIVRDTDKMSDNALLRVRNALRAASLPAPKSALEITTTSPVVCVMLLPDEDTEGELEDLCLRSFVDSGMMTCADSYFRCLDRLDQYVSDGKYAKAKLQVLLTAMGDGELTLRQAVRKSWWREKWSHPAFNDVRRFVELIATS